MRIKKIIDSLEFEDESSALEDTLLAFMGAIFLDSLSLETTNKVFNKIFRNYLEYFCKEKLESSHKRQVLLELVNSKEYIKNLKIYHTV